MPAFPTRRYMRGPDAVSTREITIGVIILLLLGTIVAALAVHAARVGEPVAQPALQEALTAARADELPLAPIPEWNAVGPSVRFGSDELHLKIDGRADLYLKHHVIALLCSTYSREGDAARTIDVYAYEMKAARDAEAVYSLEAPPRPDPVALGDAAYRAGGAVFARAGRYYLQCIPSSSDERDAAVACAIAERVLQQLASAERRTDE